MSRSIQSSSSSATSSSNAMQVVAPLRDEPPRRRSFEVLKHVSRDFAPGVVRDEGVGRSRLRLGLSPRGEVARRRGTCGPLRHERRKIALLGRGWARCMARCVRLVLAAAGPDGLRLDRLVCLRGMALVKKILYQEEVRATTVQVLQIDSLMVSLSLQFLSHSGGSFAGSPPACR